jgi:UDP-glucose 4-epimerase
MHTLILGGNGFIGSHLVDKLLQEGHRVRVFDKYVERFRKPLAGVDYRLGDFGNRGLLSEALEGVDVVYHLISTMPTGQYTDKIIQVAENKAVVCHSIKN